MDAIIRPATIDDLLVVSQLQKAFLNEHERLYDSVFYRMNDNASQEWLSWAQKKLREDELGLFVAEKNTIVGYVSGWTESRSPIYVLKNIGYLSNMYVMPAARKQGIASQLNQALLTWFKNRDIEYVELVVNSQANASVNSWIRLGYSEVSKRMRIKL